MRRLLLAAVLLGTMTAPATAATSGLPDNQPAAWADARVRALGLRHARLTVGWDAATRGAGWWRPCASAGGGRGGPGTGSGGCRARRTTLALRAR